MKNIAKSVAVLVLGGLMLGCGDKVNRLEEPVREFYSLMKAGDGNKLDEFVKSKMARRLSKNLKYDSSQTYRAIKRGFAELAKATTEPKIETIVEETILVDGSVISMIGAECEGSTLYFIVGSRSTEKDSACMIVDIALDRNECEAHFRQIIDDENAKAKKREESLTIDESDINNIRKRFQVWGSHGLVRQLDWKTVEQELTQMEAKLTSDKAKSVARDEKRKVMAMKKVEDIFIRNLTTFMFKWSKLKGSTVTGVNDKEIMLLEANGKSIKLSWVDFYLFHRGNFNELIIVFIEGGRENCKPRLSKLQWAEAMCGAAQAIQTLYSDDPAAAARSTQILQEVVQETPEYEGKIKAMFPLVDLTAKPDVQSKAKEQEKYRSITNYPELEQKVYRKIEHEDGENAAIVIGTLRRQLDSYKSNDNLARAILEKCWSHE